MPSVLFILSSAEKDLKGVSAGWYLPEAAHPYYVLSPHFTIGFASPQGANPPVGLESVKLYAEDKECVDFLQDPTVKSLLASTKKISEVNVKDYDAILYVGGHGPMIDLAFDELNGVFASEFYQSGKLTAAVCHGTVGLTKATDKEGKPLVAGKLVTGFSDVEEEIIKKVDNVPFLLEDKLIELGGKYEKADAPWDPKVVVDGNLYTGQNPNSARPLAETMFKALTK